VWGESYGVWKQMNLEWHVLNLSDNELTVLLHSNNSPSSVDFNIGPPQAIDRNDKVKRRKKSINISIVSDASRLTSMSTIAADGIYDIIPEVAMISSNSYCDATSIQTNSPPHGATLKLEIQALISDSPWSTPLSLNDDLPPVHNVF
jgi:hypothetical protein